MLLHLDGGPSPELSSDSGFMSVAVRVGGGPMASSKILHSFWTKLIDKSLLFLQKRIGV